MFFLVQSTYLENNSSWLHNNNYITLLQKTHSTPDDEQNWKHEWGGTILYAHGSNDSRNVSMLIKNLVKF